MMMVVMMMVVMMMVVMMVVMMMMVNMKMKKMIVNLKMMMNHLPAFCPSSWLRAPSLPDSVLRQFGKCKLKKKKVVKAILTNGTWESYLGNRT